MPAPAAPRVMVVEDEPNICELVCLHLGLEGYACEAVGDGQEAAVMVAAGARGVTDTASGEQRLVKAADVAIERRHGLGHNSNNRFPSSDEA